ncbi:MAG: peptidase M4, partial [Nitrospinae bacterium]|nr:peptidase M4 [Nitrospinota bacterium]
MGRLIAVLLMAVALLAPSLAVAGEGHDKAKRLKEAGEILPLESVIKTATSKKPGRVIEAELKSSRGGYIYEIELV